MTKKHLLKKRLPKKRLLKKRKPEKRPAYRLFHIAEDKRTPAQQALVDAITSGPRGKFNNSGPFAIWLHAPEFGMLAQELGGQARLRTSVPPRLSEFAILVTARLWRSQYEWFVHAPIAERAGVKAKTLAELQAGRTPKSASKDERIVFDFVHELYNTRRVSDRTYKHLHDILGGDRGVVEFVGIIGYYVMVAMSLNVFRALPPPDQALPFGAEK
jgi:4-carboxymuconolactone decarboxylase